MSVSGYISSVHRTVHVLTAGFVLCILPVLCTKLRLLILTVCMSDV